MIKIEVETPSSKVESIEAPTDMGFSLMEIFQSHGYENIKAICGGMAMCATCHVLIQSDHNLPNPSDQELEMLDTLPVIEDNSRLSCQIKINKQLEGLKIKMLDIEV